MASIILTGMNYYLSEKTYLKYFFYEPQKSLLDFPGPMRFDRKDYKKDHPEYFDVDINIKDKDYNNFINELKSGKVVSNEYLIKNLEKRGILNLDLDIDILIKLMPEKMNDYHSSLKELENKGIKEKFLLDEKLLKDLIKYLKSGKKLNQFELLKIFKE